MRRIFDWIKDFIKSGFSFHRLHRMNRRMRRTTENLSCLECGRKYEYPILDVNRKLIDGITPLMFCARACRDKYDKR
jgi:ankyrin repeat protein